MLDEQIIPRLLKRSGAPSVSLLKRFHTFGLGESHADSLLAGIAEQCDAHGIKLGFQSHFPQLEIKLALQGTDASELQRRVEPIESEVRRRLGDRIVAEDDDTLEGNILAALQAKSATVAVVETFTCGLIATRLAAAPDSRGLFRQGLLAPSHTELEHLLGCPTGTLSTGALTEEALQQTARAALARTGADYALVALAETGEKDATTPGLTVWYAVARGEGGGEVAVRRSRLLRDNAEWIRTGGTEMGLDTLRKFLKGLPVGEKTDFE